MLPDQSPRQTAATPQPSLQHTLSRLHRRPPIARLLALVAIGLFGTTAAIIIARNAMANAAQSPIILVFNPEFAQAREQITLDRAILIHRVAKAYTAARGHPPATLKALVPEFLPGVPTPVNGSIDWTYSPNAPAGSFTLSFTRHDGAHARTITIDDTTQHAAFGDQ